MHLRNSAHYTLLLSTPCLLLSKILKYHSNLINYPNLSEHGTRFPPQIKAHKIPLPTLDHVHAFVKQTECLGRAK